MARTDHPDLWAIAKLESAEEDVFIRASDFLPFTWLWDEAEDFTIYDLISIMDEEVHIRWDTYIGSRRPLEWIVEGSIRSGFFGGKLKFNIAGVLRPVITLEDLNHVFEDMRRFYTIKIMKWVGRLFTDSAPNDAQLLTVRLPSAGEVVRQYHRPKHANSTNIRHFAYQKPEVDVGKREYPKDIHWQNLPYEETLKKARRHFDRDTSDVQWAPR